MASPLFGRSKLPWLFLAVGLMAIFAMACGSADEEPPPTATTAPAGAPTAVGAVATPTAAPAATQPPTSSAPRGTVTAVVQSVDVASGFPVDCLWCASITAAGAHEALFHATRDASGNLSVGPMLVKSWTISPDFKTADFKIQEGVKFHKGFGDFTAADVAYTFNAMNTKITPEARHDSGGEVTQTLDLVEVIDSTTARFNWAAYGGTTLIQLFADAGEGIGIFPKKAFDDMGGEWMRTNIVGTGPFEMEEWTQQKGMFLRAVPDHWRKTPFVERFIYLEVPEPSTRRAMLETGEAQIGAISLKDWPALLGSDFVKAPESTKLSHAFPFGGNYWENTDPRTGEPIERVRDTSRAWVGDPYENGNTFDPNTPSMQNALKVRQALNMAIDREAINEVILSNLGNLAYIGGVSITEPIWKANEGKWKVDYDPERAKALLSEAGYANGFTVFWWAGLNSADIEISEAIAADWLSRFNIRSEQDRRTYTTIRPNLVSRTFPVLRMHGCCTDPAPWPREWIWSALGVNSYNHGLEVPKASEIQQKKVAATDVAVMSALTTEMTQYISDWQLLAAIAEVEDAPLFSNKSIAEWQMSPLINNRLGGIRNPEWVRLAQ